jgi:V8-like Glu-specific endopeptidase
MVTGLSMTSLGVLSMLVTCCIPLASGINQNDDYCGISLDSEGKISYLTKKDFSSYGEKPGISNGYIPPESKRNLLKEYSTDSPSTDSDDDNLIFGSDNRTVLQNDSEYLLYPFRMVCWIDAYFDEDGDGVEDHGYYGTGAMIGPHSVLTCSHLLYHLNGGGFARAIVFPGRHTNSSGGIVSPYGSFQATGINVGVYFNTFNANDDWGFLTLGSDIGSTTGYFGASDTAISLQSPVRLYGYHGDLNGKMGYGPGNVTDLETFRFNHNCDAISGSSGGPITYGTNTIVGIHSGGVDSTQDCACKVSSYIAGWIYDIQNPS